MADFGVNIVLKARDEATPLVKSLIRDTHKLANARKRLTKNTRDLVRTSSSLARATHKSTEGLGSNAALIEKMTADMQRLTDATRRLSLKRRELAADTRSMNAAERAARMTERGGGSGRGGGSSRDGGARRRGAGRRDWVQEYRADSGHVANAMGMVGRGVSRAANASSRAIWNIVKVGAEFERTMDEVRAFGGDEFIPFMDDLEEAARRLGKTTEFTSQDAGTAQRQLVQAGLAPQAILAALPPIMQNAQASATDLTTSARLVTAAMGQFGRESLTATEVADGFATASNLTMASMLHLGQSLGYVGGAAAAAGVSFDDTLTLLAAMGKEDIKSGRAGTSLNAMLSKLSDVASPADNALKSLLKRTKTSQKAFKNMLDTGQTIDALKLLVENMDAAGMSATEQSKRLKMAFGERGFRAFAAIAQSMRTSEEKGGFGRIEAGMAAKGGSAAEKARVATDNLKGSMKGFQSAVEDAQLTIAEELTPVLRPLVEDMTALIRSTSEWAQNNRDFLKTWGPLILKMTVFGRVFGPILSTTSDMIRLGRELAPIMQKVATNTGAAALANTRFQGAALGAKLGMIGAAGAAGLLGFAFGTWLDDTFKISDGLATIAVNADLASEGLLRARKRGAALLSDLTAAEREQLTKDKAELETLMAKLKEAQGSWFADEDELEDAIAQVQARIESVNQTGIRRGRERRAVEEIQQRTAAAATTTAVEISKGETTAEPARRVDEQGELLVRVQDDRVQAEIVRGRNIAVQNGIIPGGL